MSKKDKAKPAPEAELQALLGTALKKAFPGVKLRFETWFEVSLGKESIMVDGTAGWEKTGRADIIVHVRDKAAAVVELKRGDLKLSDRDKQQLLTYAAQHSPRPPVLVLSNGNDTRFFDGNTGAPLARKSANAKAVQKLFENAAKIAAADHDWTVETLLGPDTATWAGFVRQRSGKVVERLTGSLGDVTKPFAKGLLFPRVLAHRIAKALEDGMSASIVSGAPLAGKSSLFRELVIRNGDGKLAVLFIRAGGAGPGLFQRIANLFGEVLEWRFDEHDVRAWLRRLSNSDSAIRLVLAIDDLVAGSQVEADLEELADAGFGPGVAVLATINSDQPRRGANGRDLTALEQIATETEIEPLSQEEFEIHEKKLAAIGVHFMHGAVQSEEYRIPWLLRALLATLPAGVGTTTGVTFPAMLGVGLVASGRQRLARFGEAERGYRLLARAAFANEGPCPQELSLAMAHGFVVRRDALSAESCEAMPELLAKGWVSAFRHYSGEDVIVPRAPEMFLGAMADVVSRELETLAQSDPRAAGQWLADSLDGLFLGDVVGAQAIIDLSARRRGFPRGILDGLLDRRPRIEMLNSELLSYQAPDGSIQNLRFDEAGNIYFADEAGNAIGEALGNVGTEGLLTQVQMVGWMILSLLATIPAQNVATGAMVHPEILLEIAMSEVPLFRMAAGPQPFLTREIEGHGTVVDIENGIIEGVTSALQEMFMRDWQTLDPWIDQALARNSFPLLYRVRTALAASLSIASGPAATWMQARGDTVNAALHDLIAK